MNNALTLSVVVPTHARVELFEQTIDSLEDQSLDSFELIVSDDSKNPVDQQAIRSIVEAYRRETGRQTEYVFTKPGLGQAANTNQGMSATTGQVVRLLHSDDLLRRESLQWEIDQFQRFENLSVLFQDCIPFDDAAKIQWTDSPSLRLIDAADYFRQFLSSCTALPSGLLFSKHRLEQVKGMRTDWSFLCDWDLFARLLLRCRDDNEYVGYATAGNYGWRLHSDSTTSIKWRDHFTEHASLMAQWQLELPETAGELFIDDDDRKRFFEEGSNYRYRRLVDDCVSLSPVDYRAARPWLSSQELHQGHEKRGRRAVRRIARKRMSHWWNGAKSTVEMTSSPKPQRPPADTSAEEMPLDTRDSLLPPSTDPWHPDYVVSAFLDDPDVEPDQTSFVGPMDNAFNLWPLKDELLAAKRIRLTNPNMNRFFKRTIEEMLKYVALESEIEFVFHDNHRMTWFGLKSIVAQITGNQFELISQSQTPRVGTEKGHSKWAIRYRRVAEQPRWHSDPINGLTIGVLTLGDRPEELSNLVKTARQYATVPIEFIIVSPSPIESIQGQPDVKEIQFSERDDFGWITRKKNLICEAATHSDIVVCHDRFEFTQHFFDAFKTWGTNYGIAAPRLVLPDGRRGLDWGVVRGENLTWCQGGLISYRDYSQYSYVPGGVTLIRKSFWEQFPWSEQLYWNEHEDVELSRRVQRSGERIDLFGGKMIATRDRWVDENPMLPYSSEIDISAT